MTIAFDSPVVRLRAEASRLSSELRFHEAIAHLEQAAARFDLTVEENEDIRFSLAGHLLGIGDFARAEEVLHRLVRTAHADRGCTLLNAHRRLLELYRYTERAADARRHATALVDLARGRYDREMALRRLDLCISGEPLLRVVVEPDSSVAASETGGDEELREVVSAGYFVELHEAHALPAREYGFDPQWRRNRVSLFSIRDFINAADTAARDGNPSAGVALLRSAERLDPHSPEPPYRLGNLLACLGELQPAVAAWMRADQLAPGWEHARENICLARRAAAGELSAEVVRLALLLDGDGGHLSFERSDTYERAFAAAPNLARVWLARGYDRAFSNPRESRLAFARALATAANEHECTRALVGCGWSSRDPAERAECFEEACRMQGDLMDAAIARLGLLPRSEEDPG